MTEVFSLFFQSRMAEEVGVEVALRRLTQSFGVVSYVVLNKNGIPVQFYGMEESRAVQMAGNSTWSSNDIYKHASPRPQIHLYIFLCSKMLTCYGFFRSLLGALSSFTTFLEKEVRRRPGLACKRTKRTESLEHGHKQKKNQKPKTWSYTEKEQNS